MRAMYDLLPRPSTDRRRLLDKLLRELLRSEAQAIVVHNWGRELREKTAPRR